MKKVFLLIGLCGSLCCPALHAQVHQQGRLMPLQYPGSKTIPVIELPSFTEKKMAARDEGKPVSRLKKDEFAYTAEVHYDYHNAGVWDTLENGWKVWRMGLRSEGAVSMNLVFIPFRVEKGVRVFLSDPLQQYVLGAYTHNNNKPYEMLAVEPVPGDLVMVEMQVPPFVGDPGQLCVGIVGHEFSRNSAADRSKDGWYGQSGTCNPDILCYADSLTTLLRHAVVRIIYAGKERCTGVLLNNTRNDAKAYILTAQHCLRTEWLANTAVYLFDYESPFCGGPDGRSHKSVSGGTLKATTDNKLDFSLIELSEDIPFYYHPYFAGWDATGLSTRGVFCIHHPWGDVKKIAIDDDQPYTDNFGEGYDYNTHWRVEDWEVGTTEPGSSGAPLFSSAGRVIGNETGGDATCANSVNDYFQQLSHSWEDYPDSSRQLRYWLDPFKSTVETLKGFDPYTDFWKTGDSLSNIAPGQSLTLDGSGLSWGYYAGHNASRVEIFAERFVIDGYQYLLGADLDIARAYAHSDTAVVTVAVWEGTDYQAGPVIWETLPIFEFIENTRFFMEFDSVIAVRDTFMVGVMLEYGVPCDTFAVFHALWDNGDHNTAFIVRDERWIPMNDPAAYGRSVSLALFPLVFDSLPGIPGNLPPVISDNLMVYPNPARGDVRIAFRELPSGKVTVRLYDLAGHLVRTDIHEHYSNPLYLTMPFQARGAFVLQVITAQYTEYRKLLLLK